MLKLNTFFLLNRFSLVQKHTVEFNQLAMANSEGSEAMLNRVMTKDNIGVAALLEIRKEMIEQSGPFPVFYIPSNDFVENKRLFLSISSRCEP